MNKTFLEECNKMIDKNNWNYILTTECNKKKCGIFRIYSFKIINNIRCVTKDQLIGLYRKGIYRLNSSFYRFNNKILQFDSIYPPKNNNYLDINNNKNIEIEYGCQLSVKVIKKQNGDYDIKKNLIVKKLIDNKNKIFESGN